MGDMTEEVFYHCVSLESFSTEVPSSKGDGTTYTVSRVRAWWPESAVFDWHCTCKGWQYRKTCSHIKKVEASRDECGGFCGWSEFVEGGSVDHDKDGNPCCPKCGGEVGALRYAV